MESETQTIDVDAPAKRVFEMLANPEAMSSWTNGFVSSVEVGVDGIWRMGTTRGALNWRVVSNADLLTIDFYTEEDHPGRATYARVLPRDDVCTVVLTMIRWPNVDGERFAEMKIGLQAELQTIKALAERCPAT